uniref:HDAg domain-containing protein n=1 Tax=Timema douglasi TaxID=61478 RepID=A0A7R8VP80_TIMDO|nr:unnamed protein product [Timema douglasi]
MWQVELEEILEVAQLDSEQWVSMLAEGMKTLPATGSLNTEIGDVDENRRIFSDLVNDLRKLEDHGFNSIHFPGEGPPSPRFAPLLLGDKILQAPLVRKQTELSMLPLECHYLNKSALLNVVGQQPFTTKHFTLKRRPKSAALRAELLQKSTDAASNMKKSTAPTVPVRSRGMPRKMTDTTPLKGIPSRVPTGGFRSPTLNTSPLARPPIPRNPAGRKDGGIKLLEITEQPLGYAQAKKRKRMQVFYLDNFYSSITKTETNEGVFVDLELEESKKASEAAAAQQQLLQQNNPSAAGAQNTPDYAVGLTAMNPPTPAPATPSYTASATTIITLPRDTMGTPTVITSGSLETMETPASAQSVLVSNTSVTTTPSYVPLVVSAMQTPTTPQPATPSQVSAIQSSTVQQTVSPSTTVLVTPPSQLPTKQVIQIRPAQPVTQIRLQPVTAATSNNTQRRGLSLTREQMLEAQEMFRTANKVTRPEKALILGFMAGARDNPCPHLGNIVTIKLSENPEDVLQTDHSSLLMLVETHFQMNYNTGEWKRIKKVRNLEDITTSTPITTLTAAPAATAT